MKTTLLGKYDNSWEKQIKATLLAVSVALLSNTASASSIAVYGGDSYTLPGISINNTSGFTSNELTYTRI